MKKLEQLDSLSYLTVLERIADKIAPQLADATCRIIDVIVDTLFEQASKINTRN